MDVSFILNGQAVTVNAPPAKRLVDLLREDFGLTGVKEGCGQGECGACTIIMDGQAVHSCLIMVGQIQGTDILTIEGLAADGTPDPLQSAFVSEGAIQCGYCTPGMIMSLKALYMRDPQPTDEMIKEAIAGNICRCTGYNKILDAAHTAADLYAKEG